MLVRKVKHIDELFPALYHIGLWKNSLPMELRGWVNILGLYVQSYLEFPGQKSREYLAAGGKYKKYFYAICEYTMNGDKDSEIMASRMAGDFSYWKVRKFDQEIWERRFAHLVEPTCEIAWYISDLVKPESARYISDISDEEEFMDVVNHFKSTGDWLGLYDNKCVSCDHRVIWWDYFCCKPCPFCGGNIRQKNEAPP